MDKRTKTGLILAVLCAAAGFFCTEKLPFQNRIQPSSIFTFSIMGTTASFAFSAADADAALKAHETARTAFEQVTKIADLRSRTSELSRLNASAYEQEFICSPLLWQMIEEAAFAYHFSGGAFDITVKPLMDLWGFYRKREKAPAPAEILEVSRKTGFDKLVLDRKKRSVRFTVRGMALDLGGIAKGFALDLAEKNIRGIVASGVLDLGGNLKFLPHHPEGKAFYSVGIKDPGDPGNLKQTIRISPGSAVSTSGDYERKVTYGSRSYGHIMDPRTGCPPRKNWSATVAVPSAMRADWLSTAVFLSGKKLAQKAEKELAGCRVVLVNK